MKVEERTCDSMYDYVFRYFMKCTKRKRLTENQLPKYIPRRVFYNEFGKLEQQGLATIMRKDCVGNKYFLFLIKKTGMEYFNKHMDTDVLNEMFYIKKKEFEDNYNKTFLVDADNGESIESTINNI